MLVVHL